MSKPWPTVRLGEVLTHRKKFVTIDDFQTYKRPRVQLHAQGIVLRDEVPGALIKTKKQQVCRRGDLLVAEIDAKVGGFGIVPSELEGAIVSSHYFLFVANEDRLDRRFLGWFIKTPAFREQVEAQGSTNYAAIRSGDVLEYKIPLPPLAEQRRIVERIEAMATKIEEAKRLQKGVCGVCDNLCRSMIFDESFSASQMTPIREILRLREPDVLVQRDESYHFAGVYCFGGGAFKGQRRSGMEFSYPRLTRLKVGNFVYPKLMAWEGALAVVPLDCDGLVVSTEFPVFDVDESRVLSEVLDVYFRIPTVWPALAGASTGTNVRRRRLNPTVFLDYEMPLPAMPLQEKLRQVKAKVDTLKKLQTETAAELDALLPSILDRAFKGEL